MTAKTNTLQIRTPEGIVFSQLLAGPVTRFLAWSLDMACISALSSVASAVLGMLGLISFDLARAVTLLFFFVVSIGYGIVTEWYWRGQTVGKRLLRLRVVDAQGLRLSSSQIVIRNLLRAVDMFPLFYLVGGLACLLTRRAQRLGDLAANTIVIRTPRIAEPDLDQLMAGKFNSLRAYPHLEARLRQRVTPAEAAIALQALLRRDLLEPAARVELFQEIAEHFRAKAAFPSEATEGVTDEQYVRNVVDVVYRTREEQRRTGAASVPVASQPQPAR
jgi:uncharacterized RDD family membrane protein YckC